MAAATNLNSPIPDAVGSLLVGSILGAVASFIIYSNSAALVGRSIPSGNIQQINSELERDLMIRAVHDVKVKFVNRIKVIKLSYCYKFNPYFNFIL